MQFLTLSSFLYLLFRICFYIYTAKNVQKLKVFAVDSKKYVKIISFCYTIYKEDLP